VFWGTALVFFLAKWINVGNTTTQDFWTEVCEQIENGLFCLTGIGLIPWRLIDTYRIIIIWYYKRLTRKLRKKAGLPELYDMDDLPDPIFDPNYVHVLTDKQQYELHHQQKKFMKSQTWYRPHGTETHRAFPINTALWICLLNDGNSVFQCMLAACMWSMNRFNRPHMERWQKDETYRARRRAPTPRARDGRVATRHRLRRCYGKATRCLQPQSE